MFRSLNKHYLKLERCFSFVCMLSWAPGATKQKVNRNYCAELLSLFFFYWVACVYISALANAAYVVGRHFSAHLHSIQWWAIPIDSPIIVCIQDTFFIIVFNNKKNKMVIIVHWFSICLNRKRLRKAIKKRLIG